MSFWSLYLWQHPPSTSNARIGLSSCVSPLPPGLGSAARETTVAHRIEAHSPIATARRGWRFMGERVREREMELESRREAARRGPPPRRGDSPSFPPLFNGVACQWVGGRSSRIYFI